MFSLEAWRLLLELESPSWNLRGSKVQFLPSIYFFLFVKLGTFWGAEEKTTFRRVLTQLALLPHQCFGPGSDLYSIRSADPDPGGQKLLTKKFFFEISCFEVLDALFWGLKASPVAWTSFMEAYGYLSK
jgi:hypothetical protein